METLDKTAVTKTQPVAEPGGLTYEQLRKQYLDYCSVKRGEIDEQRLSRHYYHADQYTDEQRKAFKKRKQPVVTYNRVGRKIDAVIGLVERLRHEPKVYPRTPEHEDGAEIASSSLRYALDREKWKSISSEGARTGAIDGIGGVELSLEAGDVGDQEPTLAPVDIDTFFYDPRSFRPDFSDARFMGVAKWQDIETAKAMFPEKEAELDALIDTGGESESTAQQDRERKWIDSVQKRVFVVEHWYKLKSDWFWCFYVKGLKLNEGKSPFTDEKGRTFCKFIMFSAAVDHDGDRYGFVRNLKSPQDEINLRRSKGLHLMHSRRMLVRRGAVSDLEKTRREAAKPDGLIEWDIEKPEFEDAKNQIDVQAQLSMLQEAKSEIDAYGPNPQLLGETRGEKSGRAIALLQQAGIAELGPYIIALRDWKLSVYRAVWNAIKQYWSSERWIRVTDSDGLAQFIQINTLEPGQSGPVLTNALGQIDVDIIIDEGPDSINAMQDTYEALTNILPNIAPMLPPAKAIAAIELMVETSPLPASAKKKFKDAGSEPDPQQQEAQQINKAGQIAKIEETRSKTLKNMADAAAKQQDTQLAPARFITERQDASVDALMQARPQEQPNEFVSG